MKTDSVFKRAFNDARDIVIGIGSGGTLPSENDLSAQLGVSRTTVRKVLSALAQQKMVSGSGRGRSVTGKVRMLKKYPLAQTISVADQVERRFMEWILRDNMIPGTTINELDLARRFGVATTVIREFLNRFLHFGLIEKKPNAGWLFKGFTPAFAVELFEIREMFELRSARAFAALAEDSPLWRNLESMREEHISLLKDIDTRFHDFSDLDSRFHDLINSSIPNRFIGSFYDLITLIFHYHYQWNKHDERQRNEVAIKEHLAYIDALVGKDSSVVEYACRAHLVSAKLTLLRSTSGSAVAAIGDVRPRRGRAQ